MKARKKQSEPNAIIKNLDKNIQSLIYTYSVHKIYMQAFMTYVNVQLFMHIHIYIFIYVCIYTYLSLFIGFEGMFIDLFF